MKPEMIEKAKAAKSAEELLALAKESGVEMTADEAKTYFAQLGPKSGELSDDELDSVAGGACSRNLPYGTLVRVTSGKTCRSCGTNIGVLEMGHGGFSDIIACEKCGSKFAEVDSCTFEYIN